MNSEPIKDLQLLKQMREYLKKKNSRDYMLFILGIYSGLNISEIIALKVGQVRNKTHFVVTRRRGKYLQQIKIMPLLKRELNQYTANMALDSYLLLSRNGVNKPITRERAYGILRELADYFHLATIGGHTLRKTFGYHIFKQTNDITVVQELLGHGHPSITSRYLGVKKVNSIDDLLEKISY